MSVELEPSELGFRRPFLEHEVSQVLRIRNPNKEPLAFKVKTTAPKQYCVRPNSGKIEAGESVEVSVVLQPMKVDPAPDVKCKDKFLVQSIVVPRDQETPPWAELERSYKSSIIERKIRVQYLAADDSSKHANGAYDNNVDDSTLSSPPPTYTPQAHSGSSSAFNDTPHPIANLVSGGEKAINRESSPEPSADSSREELVRQLQEAQATIARLRADSEEGLRRRNVTAKDTVANTLAPQTLQQSGQTGVPVPTVALISLFIFLLTYLLF